MPNRTMHAAGPINASAVAGGNDMKLQTILVMGGLLLGACTSQSQSPDQTADALAAAKLKVCPDGSTVKGNKACPTSKPAPTSPAPDPATTTTTVTAVVSPNGLAGEQDIPDNFDVQ